MRVIWKDIKHLWELRNTYEHGIDKTQQAHKQQQRLLRELTTVYQERESMMAIDRDQFHSSPEEHLKLHRQPSQVATWIKMIKKTIRKSQAQARDIAQKGSRHIYTYFHRSSPISQTRRSRKRKNKKQKRTHQMYIHFNPNRQQLLSLTPEKTPVILSPKQLQPQIPWELKPRHRQQRLTEW